MRKIYVSVFLLLCYALCVNGNVVAEDAEDSKKQPEEDVPREFTDDEIKAADDLRLTLTTEEQTLYNGLRYLLRPAFEDELMKGRRYLPCTLDPFESNSDAPLDTLETLRLWAVIQSGMPVTGAMDRQLDRLLHTPAPKLELNLAPTAVIVMTARAAQQREELGRADELKTKVEALLAETDKLTDATSDRSSLIQKDRIDPRWFANHMWRGLMMRAALDMQVEIDERLWEKDIKTLAGAYKKDLGWTGTNTPVKNTSYDLHINLMALTALSAATNLPEDTISRSASKAIEKKLKYIPALLERLETDYGHEPWVGARLLGFASLAPDFSPERESADVWLADIMRKGVARLEPAGCTYARHNMARDMGLHETGWFRAHTTVCETALTCLAVSGGLHATAKGPMAGRDIKAVGRILYSLAVLHAHRARASGGDFADRVNLAIEDGCNYLAGLQDSNGRFAGAYTNYPGNTALCLLAMMHGGWNKENESIQRGIDWLTENTFKGYHTTYDVSCVLMAFQKFYESAQDKARILWVSTPEEFEDARREVWKQVGEAHRKLIEKLVSFLDHANVSGDRGGWGYARVGDRPGTDRSDNSCSQYAMLGYKAASLLGVEFKHDVFKTEAERLIRQYNVSLVAEPVEYVHEDDEREDDEKSTKTEYRATIKPGGWPYGCGGSSFSLQMTAAGISSLTICMDELKVRGKLKKVLARKIGLTIRGAEANVHANYYTPEDFEGVRNKMQTRGSDGHGVYYNLYSVERACVLAGIRSLEGETDWYRIGADALIDNQNLDGGWGVDMGARLSQDMRQVVNTCLAILFLKKASMPVITEHKKREKEREEREKEDKPKDPITGK